MPVVETVDGGHLLVIPPQAGGAPSARSAPGRPSPCAVTAALDPSRHAVIYLPNPSVGVRGMLHHIASALGQTPTFYTATLVPQTAGAFLAAEHAERGRAPVVIFDEAHLLDNSQLEAIRMLTFDRVCGCRTPRGSRGSGTRRSSSTSASWRVGIEAWTIVGKDDIGECGPQAC